VIENISTWLLRLLIVVVCLMLESRGILDAQSEVGLRLQVMQGEGNRNTVGQTAAVPIAVRVTDRNNEPIAGASVVFTAPDKGASGDFDGEISFRMLTDEKEWPLQRTTVRIGSRADIRFWFRLSIWAN